MRILYIQEKNGCKGRVISLFLLRCFRRITSKSSNFPLWHKGFFCQILEFSPNICSMTHHPPTPPHHSPPCQVSTGAHRRYELRAGELRPGSCVACAWELRTMSYEISPGRLQHSSYDVKFSWSYDLRVHKFLTFYLQKKLDFFENLWYNICIK